MKNIFEYDPYASATNNFRGLTGVDIDKASYGKLVAAHTFCVNRLKRGEMQYEDVAILIVAEFLNRSDCAFDETFVSESVGLLASIVRDQNEPPKLA